MISIVLLGAGNISRHLCKAINHSTSFRVIQVYNRSKKGFKKFPKEVAKTTQLDAIKEASVYIIAISDDAIATFSNTLPFKNKLVVHTSGSVAMESLSIINNRGVFYPLQSFSKKTKVDFSDIPICIEAEDVKDLKLLKQLGAAISENVQEVNSKQREQIHLSAVIVNNFVNFLYQIGYDIMEEQSLSFDLLKPLILETANKIKSLTPAEAQTGPAKRNDKKTIDKQLHLLKDSSYLHIYNDITSSILKKYNNH